MDLHEVEARSVPRRVRICRPAFQDMQHLVMPRLTARAQLRRHAMKLRFWSRGDVRVADLDCFQLDKEELFVLHVEDGFGLAAGFHVVFCEIPVADPSGTLCVLSVMRDDEPFSPVALNILRGRAVVAQVRLNHGD